MNKNNKLAPRLISFPSLIRDFNNMFDDLFTGLPFSNPIDFQTYYVSDDGSYIREVDVPGCKEQDLQVKIEDNLITVRGHRQTAMGTRSVSYTFSVPEGFDTANVTALLQDGVLTFTVKPLAEPPKKEAKSIPVLSAKSDDKA